MSLTPFDRKQLAAFCVSRDATCRDLEPWHGCDCLHWHERGKDGVFMRVTKGWVILEEKTDDHANVMTRTVHNAYRQANYHWRDIVASKSDIVIYRNVRTLLDAWRRRAKILGAFTCTVTKRSRN